jgi:hypothetical protein
MGGQTEGRLGKDSWRKEMILSQGNLADGLVDELLKTIHKYDETLYMSTVIGVLELVKQQLINESMENDDDLD